MAELLTASGVVDDLCRVVRETFVLGTEVTESTRLGDELSVDSFVWLEFLIAVEDRYDVPVLERVAADPPQTLADLADLIVESVEE